MFDYKPIETRINIECRGVNDTKESLIVRGTTKFECTLLHKRYEFTFKQLYPNKIRIDVSDYGLTKEREDGTMSLLDKVKCYTLDKGSTIKLCTQSMDHIESVIISWE